MLGKRLDPNLLGSGGGALHAHTRIRILCPFHRHPKVGVDCGFGNTERITLPHFCTHHSPICAVAAFLRDLDAAMRRRLEKRILIPMPDGPARLELLKLHLRGWCGWFTVEARRGGAERAHILQLALRLFHSKAWPKCRLPALYWLLPCAIYVLGAATHWGLSHGMAGACSWYMRPC